VAGVAFLGLLASGLASLLASWGLIRHYWDSAVGPFTRGVRTLDVWMHPSAYLRDAPLALIRALSVIGALLLAAATALAIYEILRVMHLA
jgi:hypothetical protein